MASVIGSISQERSWRSFQLFQQWPDVRGVVNLLIREVKSNDFITVGVAADMKLALGSAFRSPVFFEQPFARSTKLQSRAIDDQMQLACSRTRTALNRQATSPAAERRMIWKGKADRQQSHNRADQPFALTQG